MDPKALPCHDLKTERPGISGGLPPAFRLAPVAFYLCFTVGIAFNGYKLHQLRLHKAKESEFRQVTENENMQKNLLMAKQAALSAEIDEAEGIADWVKSARPVQPMALQVARSFGANTTVSEVSLVRNPEIPEHTAFTVKINGDPIRQLERTITSLNEIGYFTYSAQQVLGDNAMDYQATLVWRDGGAEPVEREIP